MLVFKTFGPALGASIPTGFELGSGLFVSSMSPELAAQALRNAEAGDD